MNIQTIKTQTQRMERTILPVFGNDVDSDDFLPQILDDEEVIIDMLQEQTHLDHRVICASLNRQIDPSYQ